MMTKKKVKPVLFIQYYENVSDPEPKETIISDKQSMKPVKLHPFNGKRKKLSTIMEEEEEEKTFDHPKNK